MKAVWQHMDILLKPGGYLLHAIDIKFQADRGMNYLLSALIFEQLFQALPETLKTRYVRATPRAYARRVKSILNMKGRLPRSIPSSFDLIMNPEILVDPPQHSYNRIIKDNMVDIRHHRDSTLLLGLKKR
jgi:hypothetical protein